MRNLFLAVTAIGILLLAGCGAAAPAPSASAAGSYETITAEQAYSRMQSGDAVTVLDVRTAEEYAENHIPNAVLLPNEEIGTQQPAQLPDLNAEILVYCRSGNRSAQAAGKLAAMGYTNVKDFGGINSWPYETEAGAAPSAGESNPATDGLLSSFTATDIDGNAVDQSIFEGHKLTMMNIWATFCGPCINEMPELGELNQMYAEQGVQVVGIVIDVVDNSGKISAAQVDTAKQIVAQTGANYLHLLPSDDLVRAKLSEVSAVPETFFVDETGAVVGKSYLGSRSGEEWQKIIDEMLLQMA